MSKTKGEKEKRLKEERERHEAANKSISEMFEYVVRDCIGAATGRVLVVTPVAQPTALVLAFRGMRLRGESAEDDIGPSLDRRALV